MTYGPYPRSMVGMRGEPFSNMTPPSLVLALHTVALAGLVGAARPALARLAAGRRVWTGTTAINLTAMTLYLWHLPVLIALYAGLHGLGLDRPVHWAADGYPIPGPGFWLWTLAFLAVYLACVVGVVRLMWPAEVGRLPGWDRPARKAPTERRRRPGRRRPIGRGGLRRGPHRDRDTDAGGDRPGGLPHPRDLVRRRPAQRGGGDRADGPRRTARPAGRIDQNPRSVQRMATRSCTSGNSMHYYCHMSDELRDLLNRVASGEISPEEAEILMNAAKAAQSDAEPPRPPSSSPRPSRSAGSACAAAPCAW